MTTKNISPAAQYLETSSTILFCASTETSENDDEEISERAMLDWINFELAQLKNDLQHHFSYELDDYDRSDHNYKMASNLISGQKNPLGIGEVCVASRDENGTDVNLFLNSPFPYFRSKLQREFECKRMALKSTLNLYYDVVAREDMVSLFMETYSEWWLRFGLEVLSGSCFPRDERPNLRKVFLDVVFPTSNMTHKLDFSQLAVLNSILLIYLLDLLRSRMDILSLSAPRLLFKRKDRDSSSMDVLSVFCDKVLQPQGDIIKQLSFYGAVFTCNQTPCDAIPYRINRLSIDLRDGIQISRLLAQVTGDASFLALPMNMPKAFHLSNVTDVFHLLEEKGFSFLVTHPTSSSFQTLEARDLVDGHREKTMALLWKIICSWKIPLILSHTQLQREIALLYQQGSIKQSPPSFVHLHEMHCQLAEAKVGHLSLLFEWCWLIGQVMSNISVLDFSSSFADGQVFTAILLYYEPHHKKQTPPHHNSMHFFIKAMEGRLPSMLPKDALMASPACILDEKMVIFLLSYLSCLFLKP